MLKPVVAFLATVILSLPAGCQFGPERQLTPALSTNGEVYVYMSPFSVDALGLSFSLNGVYAVMNDGLEFPLKLRMANFGAVPDARQRLVAWGVLPPGRYSGFAFKVKGASLRNADGSKADLLAPKKRVNAAFPFMVDGKKAVVISMKLDYEDAVKGGFSFAPAFSLKVPVKPVDALLGYAVNYGSNDITIFDKAAMKVTGVIPTGAGPVCMVLNRSLERGYVSLSREDAIDVIDMVSGAIIGRIRLDPGDAPTGLALTPDGKTLLSANSGSNTVSVIDPLNYVEVSRIKVGTQPTAIFLDRPGTKAWVLNYFSNTISIIDIASGDVAATLTTDLSPIRGAFSRNNEKFYLINEGSPYLTTIDTATLGTVQKQLTGMGMRAIKVDTNTDLIYIAKRGDPDIEVYNPFTLMPQDYIKEGGGPDYMTIDGDENNLCVADPVENALFFINLSSRKMISGIDVGIDPVWISMAGER